MPKFVINTRSVKQSEEVGTVDKDKFQINEKERKDERKEDTSKKEEKKEKK